MGIKIRRISPAAKMTKRKRQDLAEDGDGHNQLRKNHFSDKDCAKRSEDAMDSIHKRTLGPRTLDSLGEDRPILNVRRRGQTVAESTSLTSSDLTTNSV